MEKHLNELFKFLEIPSISTQKSHISDMKKAASFISNKLKKLDFTSNILKTNGHPIVYAEKIIDPESLTVLVYGHYDVQSPDPLKEWVSDPFKPEIRSGNIYARGAADDKGQLYTWIAGVEELIKAKKLKVNIKFLIEGEEEVGSKNFDDFIEKNKALLKADICVVSDSHSLSEDKPLICYGLRGLVYTQINVKTLAHDVHSGLYGGNVLNPAIVLSQIISKLKDESGKIKIPNFYDDVRILDKDEVKELENFPFQESEVKEETGATVLSGEKGFSVAARAGARPTLDVNGIWGGYIEEGQKTIIPAVSHAKISMRLVPNQNPQKIFELFKSFVQKITPKGVELEVLNLSNSNPIIMNKKSPFYKSADHAFKKVFGNSPIYELSGGSIGAAATIKKVLGIDCILMGYGLPDDGLHSPNEKLSFKMFEKGIKTNIEFLTNLR